MFLPLPLPLPLLAIKASPPTTSAVNNFFCVARIPKKKNTKTKQKRKEIVKDMSTTFQSV